MERPEHSVRKLLGALIKDVYAAYPELQPRLYADTLRTASLVRTRGLGVVMIDFPKLGSLLDSGLSCGILDYSSIPHSLGSFKKRNILFGCLLFRIFTQRGHLSSDADPNIVFFLRCILYLFKKVKLDCSLQSLDDAVSKFLSIEAQLYSPSLDWEHDEFDLSNLDFSFRTPDSTYLPLLGDPGMSTPASLRAFEEVSGILVSQFPEFLAEDTVPKHGPGAVSDLPGRGCKFTFPNWPKKLSSVFPLDSFCYSSSYNCLIASKNHGVIEPPGKLLAVPKTLKSPRLITSEPTAHQYCQQAVLGWIRKSLPGPLRLSINFRSQDPSRASALECSKDGDDATVDLSSASDRLSCWLVERSFRKSPSLLRALHACRTRYIVNATGSTHEFSIKLKKFAGQGSAVTFPVQSIIYAMCCYAAHITYHNRKVNSRNIIRAAREVRVFGDDIILPSPVVPLLVSLLEYFQLRVNVTKSHFEGKFRESCGMDAYCGYVVTPCYLSSLRLGESANDLMSWLDVSNNAHCAGLWHLANYMQEEIPDKVRRLIPVSNEELSCLRLHTFSDGLQSVKRRHSSTLHRPEVLGLQATSKVTYSSLGPYDSLLDFFIKYHDREEILPGHKSGRGRVIRNRSQLRKRWVADPVGKENIVWYSPLPSHR